MCRPIDFISIILVLILILPFSIADENALGEIKFNVENRPPKITSIKLLPESAYQDSMLECNVEIDDEFPGKSRIDFEWRKNGVALDEKSGILSGFDVGDSITCSAMPTDNYGVEGEKMSASVKILPMPLGARIAKPFLNLIGIEASTESLTSFNGMQLVTGLVAGKSGSNANLFPIIIVFALVLSAITIVARIRLSKKNSL